MSVTALLLGVAIGAALGVPAGLYFANMRRLRHVGSQPPMSIHERRMMDLLEEANELDRLAHESGMYGYAAGAYTDRKVADMLRADAEKIRTFIVEQGFEVES